MLTDEILLNNGYKKYPDNLFGSECLFQKRIRNEKGQTKYFISFYKYKHDDRDDNYEVDLQFEKDKYVINIQMVAIDNMTLEEIEQEVYKIWWELDCKYYSCDE